MTEQEWLAGEDPGPMVRYLTHETVQTWAVYWTQAHTVEQERQEPLVSRRKLRLFCCACAAREGSSGQPAYRHMGRDGGRYPGHTETDEAVLLVAWAHDHRSPSARAALLREVVGNPWRPVYLPTRRLWLTPTALSLASAAYEARQGLVSLDPYRLAVLADALEEAGCPPLAECPHCGGRGWRYVQRADGPDWEWCDRCEGGGTPHPLLAHLRSPGPHCLGCWALDLILGKE